MRVNKIFNLDVEQLHALEEHSRQTNLSKSAIVRQSITEFFHNLNQEKIRKAANDACDELFQRGRNGW